MRLLAVAFFVFLSLQQFVFRSSVVAYYYMNRTEITAMFCENKARPAMNCNGSCYLSKQIKKMEEKQASGILALLQFDEFAISPLFPDFRSEIACSSYSFADVSEEKILKGYHLHTQPPPEV
jgi:hypothetical protein